jgi:hypothetical protein
VDSARAKEGDEVVGGGVEPGGVVMNVQGTVNSARAKGAGVGVVLHSGMFSKILFCI